jgi:hypothetical protein
LVEVKINKNHREWGKSKLLPEYEQYTVKYIKDIPSHSDVLDVGSFGESGLNTTIYLKEHCDKFGAHFIHADIFNYKNEGKKYDFIIFEAYNKIHSYKKIL